MENPTDQPNELPENQPTEQASAEEATMTIDQGKLEAYIAQLKLQQNMPMAIGSGLATAVLCAILWAVITVVTEYQIGYMAIGVGFAVGYVIKVVGKGYDQSFGFLGAGLALLGCLLGNFFTVIGFIANEEGMGYFETFGAAIGYAPELMMETFSPIDLLFYGIALYLGYKTAINELSEEEIIEHGT